MNIKIILLCVFSVPFTLTAQKYTLDNETSFLQVLGTSSLHDWHVQAEKQSGTLIFSDADAFEILSISFSVESESLKSGKSGMYKKTYSTLKTDDFKTINYVFTKVLSTTEKEKGIYIVKAEGNLTICGVTNPITLDFEVSKKDSVIILSGSHKLLMTSFGVKPPKALLGTIKTGDEIEIKYKSVFIN